ncbi:MAG: sigma-70 family RNA polymerase sigma factor [Runella slithyformis]|nr:MAG: sigma-70 family RNA polymerase sigma factor [Runella slithyformis]TAF92580.1 MAG: sigma-70 family RNA polymerase sigma factor [Runella sp.]TAG23390.1 MAG: sigma-70 family RNA polymerase sigma factor [Cytophagales bacterium]TAG42565.1 MAG: sigma-70 family RNA polymerase sigma factor [Cytophagia bacterium]TAG50892.1 MAG: sigma-70 family RNA polymerase sigma factor [Runella slithyformis]
MTDQEILAKFANPESRNFAFNQLVRKYQQKIYWHIRKMVIDHDDADDLTQETFLKAWQALEKFRGDSQLFTWLYRIATNECLNFLAKKRRRFFVSINDVESELLDKLEQLSTRPESPLNGLEIELKLQKALLKLPEKQRLVFNMKYFDDLKYEDMAEITGTSVGALKASYHHAVTKIEKFLNGED